MIDRRRLIGLLGLLAWPGRKAHAAAPIALRFEEMYQSGAGGVEMSARLRQLSGETVRMIGFVAPPLKPEADFFVLTREPLSLCPFCSSSAEWPSDIVVVYLGRMLDSEPFDRPVAVTGRLELGPKLDTATAMVSLVRLASAECRALG